MPTFTMTTFETALQAKLNTANVSLSAQDYLLLTKAVKDAIEISNAVSTLAVKGVANGVASLDANVQVPSAQLTNALPSQTGNADKVLSTNGSVAAWTSTLPSPTFTGTAIATNLTASGTVTAALFSGPLTGNVTGSASLSLPLAGGTMTGALTLSGAPSSGLHATTKTYVDSQISGLVNGATGAYDTLKELADLLVADESTAATLATLVGTKAPLASPTLVTPVLGVATATSINGTTIPSSKTLVDTDSTAFVVPSQTSNSGKYLTTDGTTSSWGTVASYSAPTIGSTSITSGATVTTIAGLTLTSPVINSPKISSTYATKTAAYTFASGDEGNIFSMNNAATQQFNIPTDATFNFAVGTEFNVFWITGAGQPTIGAVTPGTTTVISTGVTSATPKLRVANSVATCKKLAANSWLVIGDIS